MLILAGLLVLSSIQPAHAADADEAEPTPLTVTLTTLSPSAIPRRGPIVLTGTVRNDSDETWSAINVHPFVSGTPITSREELDTAVGSNETVEVGTRLVDPGQFAAIGDLAPGASSYFRISLPRRVLGISGAPGVYWIGVQARGQGSEGRITAGRARTFIPLAAEGARTSATVVVPVRAKVRYASDGRVLGASAWARSFREGRLSRLADLIGSAGTSPMVVLLDPALLDVASALAAGNPGLVLGPEKEPEKQEEEQPEEEPVEPDPSPDSRAGQRIGGAMTRKAIEKTARRAARQAAARLPAAEIADAAQHWLDQITAGLRDHSVLTLGYADPDVPAVAHLHPKLLERAAALAQDALARHSLTGSPAVVPPDGWLDDASLRKLPEETRVLLSDRGAPRVRSQWRSEYGQSLVFSDARAAAGGPSPGQTQSALAVRQRILAEAVLRAGDVTEDPMVVSLPAGWDPGPDWSAASFFAGLRTPWLDLTGLGAGPGAPVFDAGLPYPQAQRRAEIGAVNLTAARSLTETGDVLGSLLDTENDVAHTLAGIGMTAVSVHARSDQGTARAEVSAADSAVRQLMAGVEVQGTDFVTLSGGSGTLTVTLVNRLDQPVVAGLRAYSADPTLRISAAKPQQLDAGQRAVIRLHATADTIGVRRVRITPVTGDGDELGTALYFNLRTSQVGRLIWGIMLAATALLIVMILRRVRRGLREHRWRGQ